MTPDEMDAVGAMKISDTLMRNERWNAAVRFLEGHAELVKRDFSLSWTMGWAHCKQEQFDEALRFLLQAIRLAQEPREECVGHWALGLSYRGLASTIRQKPLCVSLCALAITSPLDWNWR
jgi:hypothetical protein